MAMTLRLPAELEAELRLAAEEDRRSVHQTIVLAIETFLAMRETQEIKADPGALRALAEAREAVHRGDVVHGAEAVRSLRNRPLKSPARRELGFVEARVPEEFHEGLGDDELGLWDSTS